MEVEVKYPLKNPKYVTGRLNTIARQDKIKEKQKDYYLKLNETLIRIRESDSGIFVGFKERVDDISCNNISTEIKDVESIKKILNKLGFSNYKTITKIRSTWFYKNCEIAIDKLDSHRYFIEVESNKKRNFLSILKELNANIGTQDFDGYSKVN